MKRAILAGTILFLSIGSSAQTNSSVNQLLKNARRLFDAGKYSEAAREYSRITSDHPSAPEAPVAAYFCGLAKERLGQRQAALESYRDMLSRYGASSDLAASTRQRIREVELDIKRNPASAAPQVPTAAASTGTGGATGALATAVLQDILSDRVVPPPGNPRSRSPRDVRARITATPGSAMGSDTAWPATTTEAPLTGQPSWPQTGNENRPSSTEEIFPDAFAAERVGSSSVALHSDVDVISFAKAGNSTVAMAEQSIPAELSTSTKASPALMEDGSMEGSTFLATSARSGSDAATSIMRESSQTPMKTPAALTPRAAGTMYGMRASYVKRILPPSASTSMGQSAGPPPVDAVAPAKQTAPVENIKSIASASASQFDTTSGWSDIRPVDTASTRPPASSIPRALMDLRAVPSPAEIIGGDLVDPYLMQRTARIHIPPASSILRSTAYSPSLAPPPAVEKGASIPAPITRTASEDEMVEESLFESPERGKSGNPEIVTADSSVPAIENGFVEPLPSIRKQSSADVPLPSIWDQTSDMTAGMPAQAEADQTISATLPITSEIMSGFSPAEPSRSVVIDPVQSSLSGELFAPMPPPLMSPSSPVFSEPTIENQEPTPSIRAFSRPPAGASEEDVIKPVSITPLDIEYRALPSSTSSSAQQAATRQAASATEPGTALMDQQIADASLPTSSAASATSSLPVPEVGLSIDATRKAILSEPSGSPRSSRPSTSMRAPANQVPSSPAIASAGPTDATIRKAIEFRKLGFTDQAVEEYRKALELDPSSAVARNNLADIWVEQGTNLEQAVQYLKEALTMDLPDKGPFYSTLGWAYAKLGDYENSEKFLNEAIRIRVTSSRLYRRGRLYAAMGMASRARADLDRALVYSEDHATTEMIRKAIESIGAELPLQGGASGVR